MPRRNKNIDPNNNERPPFAIRIIGLITALLSIICLTISCNAPDMRIQIGFLIAGMLYFLTILVLVFENGVDTGQEN